MVRIEGTLGGILTDQDNSRRCSTSPTRVALSSGIRLIRSRRASFSAEVDATRD